MNPIELLVAVATALIATSLMTAWFAWTRRVRTERLQRSLEQVDSSIQRALAAHRIVRDAVGADRRGELALLEMLDQRTELAEAAQQVLNRLEYIGLGVQARVLDLRIVDRLAGRTILSMWTFYFPYIRFLRSKDNAPDLYRELELLAHQLQGSRHASAEEAEAFHARWPSVGGAP